MGRITYKPSKITVEQLIAYRDYDTTAISGFDVQNLTVPPHLVSKKRITEAANTVSVLIRTLFNSITNDEDKMQAAKDHLKSIVHEKVTSVEIIDEIANEILENFLISAQNIANYIQLLNVIDRACIPMPSDGPEPKHSRTLGYHFLQRCRIAIFKYISDKHIRELGELDLEDADETDDYNKARDKINNLILTLCSIYDQRTTHTLNVTALHLYPLLNTIMNAYSNCMKQMDDLGDPYKGDGVCKDEKLYFTTQRMSILYAEQIYTFMSQKAYEFNQDATEVKDAFNPKTICTLADAVNRFRNDIVPTFTERYMISNCKAILYGDEK